MELTLFEIYSRQFGPLQPRSAQFCAPKAHACKKRSHELCPLQLGPIQPDVVQLKSAAARASLRPDEMFLQTLPQLECVHLGW